VGVAEARLRWRHEMRGEDPDDPDIAWADVEQELRRAFDLLRDLLEEKGIDPDDIEAPSTSLTEARVKKLGVQYATSLRHLEPRGDAAPRLEAARRAALTVGSKLARISADLDAGDGETWAWDTVPNLLLIERLDRDITDCMDRLAGVSEIDDREFRRARAEMLRIVTPLLEVVPHSARSALDRLAEAGRAPSPFHRIEMPPAGTVSSRGPVV
jgi:hypothetical protein